MNVRVCDYKENCASVIWLCAAAEKPQDGCSSLLLLPLPLRGDLERLPSSVVPRAVVPNLYLQSACSPSPTRAFSLRHLRTAMLDEKLVPQGSCCLRLASLLLHLLAVVLSSRLDWLPLLADSRLDSPRLSLAETSGVTPRHRDVENIYKFESQNDASTQIERLETSFSSTKPLNATSYFYFNTCLNILIIIKVIRIKSI